MAGGLVFGAFTSCLDVVEGSVQLEPTCAKELSVRRKSNADLEAEVIAHVSKDGCKDAFKCGTCLNDLVELISHVEPICTHSSNLLM